MTKKIVQVMSVDDRWVDSGLKYELDSHGWVLKKSYYDPNGELCRKNEYTYDENGKMTSDLYYNEYDGTLDYPGSIYLASYNASGKKTSGTYLNWFEEENDWGALKYKYSYDDHDNLTNIVLYSGDCSNGNGPWGWWNSYTVDEWSIFNLNWAGGKHSYQYDDHGRIVADTVYYYEDIWSPETEYIETITEYQYDESGNIITETWYSYEDEFYLEKYEYIYNEFGNLVRQNYYYISNDQWYLDHYDIYYYSNSSEIIENITKEPLLTSPRKVFKNGKLQIDINGQSFGMDGIRF